MRAILIAVLLIPWLAACGAGTPKKPLTNEWPTAAIDDDDYKDITKDWTRSAVLHGDYQEVLELAATLKTPEWRLVHAERDAKNRGLVGAAHDQRIAQAKADAEGPYEFELMVTTWDQSENDLDRGAKAAWRVTLLDGSGKEIAPLEVTRDRRRPFVVRTEFPAFGDFAKGYIVKFPRDANVLGPGVKQVRLRMSGERGGVEVTWDAP